jgi:hypothetical protein
LARRGDLRWEEQPEHIFVYAPTPTSYWIVGDFDYAWQLETLDDGQWKVRSKTMKIPLPFWRRRRVRFLQNSVVNS